MEKLLALSILSSMPAEVSGGSSWMMNVSLFKKGGVKSGEVAESSVKSGNSQEAKQRLPSSSQGQKADAKQKQQQHQKTKGSSRAWLAPEFDGLNCFETLVSH